MVPKTPGLDNASNHKPKFQEGERYGYPHNGYYDNTHLLSSHIKVEGPHGLRWEYVGRTYNSLIHKDKFVSQWQNTETTFR